MKPSFKSSIKQKEINRLEKFSKKIYSQTNIPSELHYVSPKTNAYFKGNYQFLDPQHTKNESNNQLQSQKIQFKKFVELQIPQKRLRKNSKLNSFKSEDVFSTKRSPNRIHQIKSTEQKIKEIVNQYQKDLIQNQQKKTKITMQTAVINRQIQFVLKQKQILCSSNKKLKNELILLRKQLLLLKDNQQRMKRIYELDLYKKTSQIQQNKVLNIELKGTIKNLKIKTESISELENAIQILKIQNIKAIECSEKLKQLNWQLNEKCKTIQCNYKILYQSYAKLQVNCQSMKTQLVITKEYLSRTQQILSSTKEENYKNNEQKLKQIGQKASIIATLSSEVSFLSSKIQESQLNFHNSQQTVSQLQKQIEQYKKAQIVCTLMKSKVDQQLLILNKKILTTEQENKIYSQQISALKIFYQQQTIQTNQQWTLALRQELDRISIEKNQQLAKLQHMLLIAEQKNKQFIQNDQKKQTELLNLKEILGNKQKQISDYIQQIKIGIQKQNNLKQQIKQLLQKQAELLQEIQKIKEKLVQSLQKLQIVVADSAINLSARDKELALLKENIEIKQKSIINAELQILKQQQKSNSLSTTKDFINFQQLNQMKTQIQYFIRALNNQKIKNQQFASQITIKQAENMKQFSTILEIQKKIQIFGEQMEKLIKFNQQIQQNCYRKYRIFSQQQKNNNDPNKIDKKIESVLNKLKQNIFFLKSRGDQLQSLNSKFNQDQIAKCKTIEQLTLNSLENQKKLQNLRMQNNEYRINIKKLECQRQDLSKAVQMRVKAIQALKKQMISLQDQLRTQFDQNINEQQANFKMQLRQLQNQKLQLKRQIDLLNLYKIKSQELQNQIYNLSILFRNQTVKLQAERSKNLSLLEHRNQQWKQNQEAKSAIAANYDQKIYKLTEDYQQEKQNMQIQISRVSKQNQKLKNELSSISSQLIASNNKINYLILQLEGFKILQNTHNQTIQGEEMQTLKRVKESIFSQNNNILQNYPPMHNLRQSELLISSNDLALKKGMFNFTLNLIGKQLQQIKKLADFLKDQRQILIKKYVLIANQVMKNEKQLQLSRQVDGLGQHFTNVSLLHNQLNKAILRIQRILTENSTSQKQIE